MEKAVNGFRATGIMPFNRDVFQDEEFVAEPQESIGVNMENPRPDDNELDLEAELNIVNGIANTDNVNQNIIAELQSLNEGYNENDQNVFNENEIEDLSMEVLQEVIPMPSFSTTLSKKRGGNQIQHSEILTSSPVRELLEEKKLKQLAKIQKAEEVKKRKEINAKKKIEKQEEIRKRKELRAQKKAKKALDVQKKKEIKEKKAAEKLKKKEGTEVNKKTANTKRILPKRNMERCSGLRI